MSGGCVAVGSSERAIYLASSSRFDITGLGMKEQQGSKVVWGSMRPQLRTRHPHFQHILLATASHEAGSDPRNEKWWKQQQSHIAKGVDSGRRGELSAMPTIGHIHNINQVKSKNWFCCNSTHLCVLLILCT